MPSRRQWPPGSVWGRQGRWPVGGGADGQWLWGWSGKSGGRKRNCGSRAVATGGRAAEAVAEGEALEAHGRPCVLCVWGKGSFDYFFLKQVRVGEIQPKFSHILKKSATARRDKYHDIIIIILPTISSTYYG